MEWPDSLDALTAAPNHHSLVLETDELRVLETHVPPGERTPLHTHRWPAVLYVLAGGRFVRRNPDGAVALEASVGEPGTASLADAFPPHTFENVGDTVIRVLAIELKRG